MATRSTCATWVKGAQEHVVQVSPLELWLFLLSYWTVYQIPTLS